MEVLCRNRCYIGEGPIWNEKERKLYFVNPGEKEICIADVYTGKLSVRKLEEKVSALAFAKDGSMLVSRKDGAYLLREDGAIENLYDPSKYRLKNCNDAKVGPDGRFYVGTQSSKRLGISEEVDGKLYSVDKDGNVKVLLEQMRLSNGFDWSMDEERLYHTDSDTHQIREFRFYKETGELENTGRVVFVPGVDGLTIGQDDCIYAACWGQGHVAKIDTKTLQGTEHIKVPTPIPASCAFAGDQMEFLAVTTCLFEYEQTSEPGAGFTYLHKMAIRGRKPYLFG